MSLRAEQQNNSKQGRSSAQSDSRSFSQQLRVTPDPDGMPETRQEVTPELQKQQNQRVELKKEEMEERQEPEGRQADTTVTERGRREVRRHRRSTYTRVFGQV